MTPKHRFTPRSFRLWDVQVIEILVLREHAAFSKSHLGGQSESAIRTSTRPVFVASRASQHPAPRHCPWEECRLSR